MINKFSTRKKVIKSSILTFFNNSKIDDAQNPHSINLECPLRQHDYQRSRSIVQTLNPASHSIQLYRRIWNGMERQWNAMIEMIS